MNVQIFPSPFPFLFSCLPADAELPVHFPETELHVLTSTRAIINIFVNSQFLFSRVETLCATRQRLELSEGPETRNKLQRLNGRRRNNCVEAGHDLSEREEGEVGTKSSALGSSPFARLP